MMRKNKLLIVLFIGVAAAFWLGSCTYDYFVDETNYTIHVPDTVSYKFDNDYRVLIYNSDRKIVRSLGAYTQTPKLDKNRLLRFRLAPGRYTVYFYVNTGSLPFVGEEEGSDLDAAAFSLNSVSGTNSGGASGEVRYEQPPHIFFDTFISRDIRSGGSIVRDTLKNLREYTGSITVNFTGCPLRTRNRIKNVKLLALHTGIKQLLNKLPLTDSPSGSMYDFSPLPPQEEGDTVIKVCHRFLPSVVGEHMQLEYTFCGNSVDEPILPNIPIPINKSSNDTPDTPFLKLLSGENIIINYVLQTLDTDPPEGWHPGGTGDTDLQ